MVSNDIRSLKYLIEETKYYRIKRQVTFPCSCQLQHLYFLLLTRNKLIVVLIDIFSGNGGSELYAHP
jgi:hypothetical protein